MRHKIKVTGLTQNVDKSGQNYIPGMLLGYKKEGSEVIEVAILDGTQKAVMEMFKIENFTDIVGQKFDVNFEDTADGKKRLSDIKTIDDRQLTYVEYEKIMSCVADLHKDVHKVLLLLNTETKKPTQP